MTQHYLDLHKNQPVSRLPWLQKYRNEALAQFAEIGFPRNEAWKYTQLAPFARKSFVPVSQAPKLDASVLQTLNLDWPDAYRLVFLDGHYQPHLSKLNMLPGGVVISSLDDALSHHEDLIQVFLGRHAELTASESLSALNTAFINDGYFVYLPQGVALEQALHVVFISNAADNLVQPRNLIIAAENSHGRIIEHTVSLGDNPGFTNSVTEVSADTNSRVEHFKLQEQNLKTLHVSALHVQQTQASSFSSHVLLLGGQVTRNAIHAKLDAEQADCQLYGLYLLNGRQHADNFTRIEHNEPHCTSKEYYKGILGDHARGIFTGRVYVAQDAQLTDSQQTNHNLLLSEDAEADTRPQLEIYADDVKCSHGATIGQLDETALFYLRSRGIDAITARNLLIYAFAEEVLDFIELPGLHEQMRSRLISRLPSSDMIRQLVM
jgi:Fe-S cluster assembly protein SufD